MAGFSELFGQLSSPEREHLRELFSGWPAPIPALLGHFVEAELKSLEIHDLAPLSREEKKRCLSTSESMATS